MTLELFRVGPDVLNVGLSSFAESIARAGGNVTAVEWTPPAAGDRTLAAAPEQPGSGASITVLLDGRSQSFVLPEDGMSILDATLRYRADAPFACKNGVCGTCRAKVVEGKVAMDSNYALEPAEVAAGYALACQSHPAADRVVIDFDQ